MLGALLGTVPEAAGPAFPLPLSRDIIAAQVTGAGGPRHHNEQQAIEYASLYLRVLMSIKLSTISLYC